MKNAVFQQRPDSTPSDKLWKNLNGLHDGFLLMVLTAVVLISGYCLYDNWYILSHASDANLLQYKPDSSQQTGPSPIADGMVGWLTLDGTNIDFPVMQGESNLTFLNKNPYGEFSLSGSIFLDSRNTPDFTDTYSLIYGHHMEYGKMFGALDAYLDKAYADSHRNGVILIGRDGRERRHITVFAVLRVAARDNTVFDVEQPLPARDYIISHAEFLLGEPGEHWIVLSTCDGEDDTMRIMVVCNIE